MTEPNTINDSLDYMPETIDKPCADLVIETISKHLIDNPFINTQCIITHLDSKSGTLIDINQTNAKYYFDTVFLLVKKTDDPIPIEFYNLKVSSDIIKQVSSNLILYKASIKLLNNKTHFDSIIMLSNEQLKEYNIFNYTLETKNIIIPIFNIAFKNVIKYYEQYHSTNTLYHIYKVKILNQYFKIEESNHRSNKFINQIITNLKDSEYWTKPRNCKPTWTTEFNNRTFTFQTNRITDKTISQIIIEILNYKTKINDAENYIEKIGNKKKYTDISSVINKKQSKKFSKDRSNNVFSHNDINQLFDVLNKQQQFLLFINLMISKKYAHLVINNKYILDLMNENIIKYKQLIRYLLSYTWIQFYFDECLQNSFTKTTDNHIFDIDTASKLPIYPFIYDEPRLNPYMPILVTMHDLKPYSNLGGIPTYNLFETKLNNNGIVSLEGFKERFNIFCTGNIDNDLFDNINFDKYKIGITGSVITACVQKEHPLMTRLVKGRTMNEHFNNYFNEYYALSDIDIMMKTKCEFKFIDNVKEIYLHIVANISKFSGLEKEFLFSNVKLCLNKLSYLFVSEDFIKKNIYNLIDDKISDKLNYIKEHIDQEHIKELFKPHYLNEQLKYLAHMTNDTYNSLDYPEIFTQECDFKIFINNQNLTKNFKDIDIEVTYKYKITSPHLNHALEIFSIKYDDFMGLVSGFHLPCVRGYYNGSNVFLTPSCISAHLTYMNIDYKYMVSGKDPIEILNKNRMRGFGTWLNKKEKILVFKYSIRVPFWSNIFRCSASALTRICTHDGFLDLNHRLFRPRLINKNFYDEVGAPFVDMEDRYLNDALPAKLRFKNIDLIDSLSLQSKDNKIDNKIDNKTPIIKQIDWLQLTAIDHMGNINPLKKWVIDMVGSLY